jgi:predicted ester cyclase
MVLEEVLTMVEENKVIVRRFVEEVYNKGNLDSIADYFIQGSFLAGGHAGQVKVMKTAFPDNHFTIEEMIAESDQVVARMTVRGTNSGPIAGLPAFGKLETPIPATGKQTMSTAIYIFTLRDGKIASITAELDQIGMLQQMGWKITPPNS